jgi:hypothetical protein
VETLRSWNYRISLIIEDNDLEIFIIEDVQEPINAPSKAKHQKDIVRAKRIIVDSIKYHLIPQVASNKTSK